MQEEEAWRSARQAAQEGEGSSDGSSDGEEERGGFLHRNVFAPKRVFLFAFGFALGFALGFVYVLTCFCPLFVL